MSSLQDIPLAELPENSLPSTGHDTSTPKSNSLKRFFKLGNKKSPNALESCEDVSVTGIPEVSKKPVTSGGGGGGGGGGGIKSNTLSRIFSRRKGTEEDGLDVASTFSKSTANFNNKTEAEEQNREMAKESTTRAPENVKPLPNSKPTTLKTSISSYWKLLFNRQKAAANQQTKVNSVEAQQQSVHHVDEVHELEMVQQEQQEQQLELVTEQPHDATTDLPNAGGSSTETTIKIQTSQQELTSKILSSNNQAGIIPEIQEVDGSMAKSRKLE